jgi:hypothetical protein
MQTQGWNDGNGFVIRTKREIHKTSQVRMDSSPSEKLRQALCRLGVGMTINDLSFRTKREIHNTSQVRMDSSPSVKLGQAVFLDLLCYHIGESVITCMRSRGHHD